MQQGPMNFISSASSLVGGGCSAGSASKAVVTLDKFFFPGALQPGKKQQGVPQTFCCTRRQQQRTTCADAAAAATAAKRARTRSTQLHIAEYFSLSSTTASSSSTGRRATEKQLEQTAASTTEARFCSSASSSDDLLQQSDIPRDAATESPCKQRCTSNSSSSPSVEERQELHCKRKRSKEDETKRKGSCDTSVRGAVLVASSRFRGREGAGGLGRKANAAAGAAGTTTPPRCAPGTNNEGSSGATKGEKTASPADVVDSTNLKKVLEEGEMPCRAEGLISVHSAVRHVRQDLKETCPFSTEAHTASAATSTVVGHPATARASAQEQATPAFPESNMVLTAVSSPARGNVTAAASKKISVVDVSGCAKGAFLRCVTTTTVSAPPVPALDPEGQYVADLSQFEQRWRAALGDSWFEELRDEIRLPYFADCLLFVRKERQRYRVFPPEHLLFHAFRSTPLDKIKVVIIGQDPYHQLGQAMGLAFSVPRGVPVPPSLQNIFKEIDRNYPIRERVDITGKLWKAQNGDLTEWAKQGVFLMNTLLTVRENSPLSHKNAGWERFTNKVVNVINTRCDGIVFLLWGKPAQKKSSMLDRQRHLILEAGHPSPLSVRFFEGCQHFLKCNEYLLSKGKTQIVFTRCLW